MSEIVIMAQPDLPVPSGRGRAGRPVEMGQWRELRDERGKLCARVDAHRLLLEVRRNHGTVIFELRDYIEALTTIDSLKKER